MPIYLGNTKLNSNFYLGTQPIGSIYDGTTQVSDGNYIYYPVDENPGTLIAYGLRKLSSTYTGPAVDIYNWDTGVTQSIYFDEKGNLNTGSISSSFYSASGVGIAKWYDQSGNNYNPINLTPSQMARFMSSGSFSLQNGKPVSQWIEGDERYFIPTSSVFTNDGAGTMAYVTKPGDKTDSLNPVFFVNGLQTQGSGMGATWENTFSYSSPGARASIDVTNGGVETTTTQSFNTWYTRTDRWTSRLNLKNAGVAKIDINNQSQTLQAFGVDPLTLNSNQKHLGFWYGGEGGYGLSGSLAEFMAWTSSLSDLAVLQIQDNQNTYWSVY